VGGGIRRALPWSDGHRQTMTDPPCTAGKTEDSLASHEPVPPGETAEESPPLPPDPKGEEIAGVRLATSKPQGAERPDAVAITRATRQALPLVLSFVVHHGIRLVPDYRPDLEQPIDEIRVLRGLPGRSCA